MIIWIPLIFSIILNIIFIVDKYRVKKEVITEQELVLLLYNKLYDYCKDKIMRGTVTEEELDIIEYNYKVYCSLNGVKPGVCDDLVNQCRRLPIKKKKVQLYE